MLNAFSGMQTEKMYECLEKNGLGLSDVTVFDTYEELRRTDF